MSGLRYSVFFLTLFVIYTISCVDIYWTARVGRHIVTEEQNPIAREIILNFGHSFFIAIKSFVTILSVQMVSMVYFCRKDTHRYSLILEILVAVWLVEQLITLYILLQ